MHLLLVSVLVDLRLLVPGNLNDLTLRQLILAVRYGFHVQVIARLNHLALAAILHLPKQLLKGHRLRDRAKDATRIGRPVQTVNGTRLGSLIDYSATLELI